LEGVLRIGIGRFTTEQEIEQAAEIISNAIEIISNAIYVIQKLMVVSPFW
jgi:cysteine sulfinate desulfinase/cysteine desulfurase-like protein